ncbi:ORF59 [Retroperitoneal fibromatosis-associated herpesvirus]|uniref:ORF59 n=1 Tax=Retroperitoneal fibromatosis-associated herpesvirus TaxID=111469 RepID=U5NIG6_9GAMA|nr:ORF59 [Retroperitoneal fibromatosis-associated herpesvirus]AGY30745.1 ORF59 [Retroperitoneal fibromatosis-associated herpesvirus]
MPVDFHYGVRVDAEFLYGLRRVHDHLKTSIKSGVIQIHGPGTAPVLSVLSSLGPAGVLGLRVKNVLSPLLGSCDADGEVNFSFRNTSIGNGFTHTREIFGSNILETSIVFYRKGEAYQGTPVPQFVRTTISYSDNVTTTVHKSVLDPNNLPAFYDRMEPGIKTNRLLLCGKTLTMLTRWLRQQKTRADQTVTVAASETLSVVTFSVAGVSKILDFSPETSATADWETLKRKKQIDVGVVRTDAATQVSLESLLAALRLCKIPGWFTPGLVWHSNDILEVEGVSIASHPCDVKLSVLLLKVDEQSISEHRETHEKPPKDQPTPALDVSEEIRPPSPISPPVTPGGEFCAGISPKEGKQPRIDLHLPSVAGKESRRGQKRRSAAGIGRERGKVSKTTFNPLI